MLASLKMYSNDLSLFLANTDFLFQLFKCTIRMRHNAVALKEQIAANRRVIEAAKGMLAAINGSETHLTVGTGHCAAFCRAANNGCQTPVSYLQDSQGKINIGFLKMQPHYRKMLEEGWSFLQISWKVEAAWPSSPDMLQRALNANNDVHSSPTEIEGMVTVAECLESGMTEEAAIEVATEGSPVWAEYAKTIAQVAMKYGGGKQAPLLHRLDAFAKKHSENRRLGEEFLGAVATVKFSDNQVRAAFLE